MTLNKRFWEAPQGFLFICIFSFYFDFKLIFILVFVYFFFWDYMSK